MMVAQAQLRQPDVGDQPGLIADDSVELDPEYRKTAVRSIGQTNRPAPDLDVHRRKRPDPFGLPGTISVVGAKRKNWMTKLRTWLFLPCIAPLRVSATRRRGRHV